MIPDDETDCRLIYSAADACRMVESLIAFGLLRSFPHREVVNYFSCQSDGVEHLAFGIAGMNVSPLYSDSCSSGIEVLIFNLTHFTSVHRVCPITAETLHVKLMCSQADLFIRIKSDADFSVFDFGMFLKIFNGRDYLSNSCLVVGTEQGMPVGNNQIFTDMVLQFGKLRRRKDDVFLSTQRDVSSLIVLDNSRIHILSAHVWAGVEMRDKADSWNVTLGIRRQRSKEIAVVVKGDVFQAHLQEFIFKRRGKGHLPRRARCCLGCLG